VNLVNQRENTVLFEKLRIRTPLGIRFWDHGANEPIRDQLTVTAWPRATAASPTYAVRNPSGIYSFHGLPGLRHWEYPAEDEDYESSPPINTQFIVQVEDSQKRFLKVAAIVEAPHPDDRLFGNTVSSPPIGEKGFRLFSAPNRPIKSHLAVVRAYVWDNSQNIKAAHAVLKISITGIGTPWTGIADENGMIAVMFPYPMTMQSIDVSPPSSRIPIHKQTWKISARAFYGGTDMRPLPNTELPNLANVIQQKQAKIFETSATSADEITDDLTLGKELVLRTKHTAEEHRAKLIIEPLN
jgi:hypothetical protein